MIDCAGSAHCSLVLTIAILRLEVWDLRSPPDTSTSNQGILTAEKHGRKSSEIALSAIGELQSTDSRSSDRTLHCEGSVRKSGNRLTISSSHFF
jgi:hypothetical protein